MACHRARDTQAGGRSKFDCSFPMLSPGMNWAVRTCRTLLHGWRSAVCSQAGLQELDSCVSRRYSLSWACSSRQLGLVETVSGHAQAFLGQGMGRQTRATLQLKTCSIVPLVGPDEKRQSMVLKHFLSCRRVEMSEIISYFLRAGLRLNTFCREEYLGRRA